MMKVASCSAVLALSFCGVVSAATISETLTGTVTSGIDAAGLFGAANTDLTGSAFSLTYSYNLTLLNTNGSYFTDGSSLEVFHDNTTDGAALESITINALTYSMTTVAGLTPVQTVVTQSLSPTTTKFSTITETGAGVTGRYINPILSSNVAFAIGQISSQASMDTFVANIAPGTIDLYGNNAFDGLSVTFNQGSSSPAPEPATGILLAMSLSVAIRLKLRRAGTR